MNQNYHRACVGIRLQAAAYTDGSAFYTAIGVCYNAGWSVSHCNLITRLAARSSR